eukprot:8919399-Pyramimonas_sp.AAC.1
MDGGRATGKTGGRRGGEGGDADGRRSTKADGGPRGGEGQEERSERGRREACLQAEEGQGGPPKVYIRNSPCPGGPPTDDVSSSNFEARTSKSGGLS